MRRGPQGAQSLIGRAQQSVKRAGFEKRSGMCHAADCPIQAKTRKKAKTPKKLTYDVLFSFLSRHETKGPHHLLQASNALTPQSQKAFASRCPLWCNSANF
jgi:hypothetical protein